MKKVITVLFLMLIFGSPLFAGGSTEGPAATGGTDEPQYGGTFTDFALSDPPSPDELDAAFNALNWLTVIQEHPVMGDFVKYGPRGTNDWAFTAMGYIPDQYQTGQLLESWTVDHDKMVWHLRPGIYWAPSEAQSAWMKLREVTADDLADDTIRFLNGAWGSRFKGLLAEDGVKVIDKYTLQLNTLSYSPSTFYYLAYEDRSVIAPPEMHGTVDRAKRWENQVGTGPWIFKEYVVGSHMTLVKNNNYWMKATIKGEEYKLPFIETFTRTIIPDVSTQLAALQTAKVTIATLVEPTYWTMLDKQASQLKMNEYVRGTTCIDFRADQPPFDNPKVRQAMHIGTNLDQFRKFAMVPNDTPYVWDPVQPGDPAYIPLKELPEDIQKYYDYNPELAKRMLAEAGYPNGFKTAILTQTTVEWQDACAQLQEQWAKIGVDLQINAVEDVEYSRQRYPLPAPLYRGTLIDRMAQHNPVSFFDIAVQSIPAGYLNYGAYSNPEVDKLIVQIRAEVDAAKRVALLKQASIMYQRDVGRINLYPTRYRIYWWPWLKNYYGEYTAQDDNWHCAPIIAHAWIDQKLRREMGY